MNGLQVAGCRFQGKHRNVSFQLNATIITIKTLADQFLIKPVNYIIGAIFFIVLSMSVYGQRTNKSIPTINIESGMKSMEVINLSLFASSIRYIPLETSSDLNLSYISDCIFYGKQILIVNLRECWLFDSNGKFLKKIGAQGRGPGEYQFVVNIGLDSQNKIYIQSLRDVLEYRLDGSFIKKYNNLFMFNNNLNDYFSRWIIISDSLIFGHIPNREGNSTIKARLINQAGNIKKQYKNYDQFIVPPKSMRNSPDNDAQIYAYKKSFYYKGPNNDTLFYLDKQFNLVPLYVFNPGKYKEPANERSVPFGKEVLNRYLFVRKVFQTENYLFINCELGDYFPAKRITPKIIKSPSGKNFNVWFNTFIALGIYDRKTRIFSFSKPTSTDNPLFTSGFYNDIDAGPRFLPEIQVNDSTMVMWIDAKKLKEHISSADFKNNSSKFPEKKKELERLANKISDYDNPVLMEVTFRK